MTFTSQCSSLRIILASILLCIAAVFMATAQPAYAQSTGDTKNAALLQQIQMLMQMISDLKAQLSHSGSATTQGASPEHTYTLISGDSDGSPRISLVLPKSNQTFDKSKTHDPVIVSWKADNVPENSVVEVHLKNVKGNGPIGGGVWQGAIPEGDSTGTYRWSISGEGRASAGTYRVQTLIRECHSKGCAFNPDFPGQEEDVEIYDTSYTRTIKIVGESVVPGPTGLGIVTSISDGTNPTVWGTAASGVTTVGFSIGSSGGDKVYGSGSIPVVNGVWNHKVAESLTEGSYTLTLYVHSKTAATKKFSIE